MEKAKVAGMEPVCVSVVPEKVYPWCTCGLSEKQPFCDGAHSRNNTGMKPMIYKCEKSETVYFCGCKHSKTPPFCDGTHSSL